MASSPGTIGSASIEAEITTAVATTRLVWFEMATPPDHRVRWDRYYLDLSLTPRPLNMRASYSERWGPQRYVPVGEMFLVPPGELLHIKADSPFRQTSIVCEIHADILHDWLGFPIDWNDRRLEASLDITNTAIRHLLRKLAEEARRPGLSSDKFVEFVSGQLALEIGRHLEVVDDTPVKGGLSPWRLRIIDDRLKQKGDMPTLDELADLCSISVRQLTRGFRTSRDCTIRNYMSQNRIENSKRLLHAGENIKAIAHELGYASTSSFTYAFKSAIGITPRQFRHRVYRSK